MERIISHSGGAEDIVKAVGLDFGRRELCQRERPEPELSCPGSVLLAVREVGICGTDRELALFHFGDPPPGEDFLIIGHEALAQVVETGPRVTRFRRGDWVVPMVRRSCEPACASCARGRTDLCLTDAYTERGIFGAHGYLAPLASDLEANVVRVPPELLDIAVLVEPLSVVEKAVETALRIHEPGAARALVFGAGPIGILAALVLQLRGLEVSVHSIEPPSHPRVRLLERAGIRYLRNPDGATADVVIEAAGSAKAAFAGLRALAPLGVCGVLGAANSYGDMPFLDLLRRNQTLFGSVNAGPPAFAAAVADLARLDGSVLRAMIRRVRLDEYSHTVTAPAGDAAKIVHVVTDA